VLHVVREDALDPEPYDFWVGGAHYVPIVAWLRCCGELVISCPLCAV
jgi:hypothetical protein